jgi:hypothetical protein
MAETDLYAPIKRFLEHQGYVVKAELRRCDVVGVRGDEPPVIVELKTALNLQLFYQAIDRLTMTESVYIAIAQPKRKVPSEAVRLCRRIGIGLIVVAHSGSVEVMADPAPYVPRANAKARGLLLREFMQRKGDPNRGGSGGLKLVTAYRQDALRCVGHLHASGPARLRDLRTASGVERAAAILRDNVYGWFVRTARGVYDLSEQGRAAIILYGADLDLIYPPVTGGKNATSRAASRLALRATCS